MFMELGICVYEAFIEEKYICNMRKIIIITFITTALNAATFLESVIEPATGLWTIGAKVQQGVYVDSTPKMSVVPYIFGSYGFVNIEANRVDVTLYGNGLVYASVVGQYRSQETREETSPYGKRKSAIELGGQAGLILGGDFVLRSSLLYDVSNTHKGYEVDTQVFRHDSWGNFFLLSSIGVQYQSSNLTEYYYGTEQYEPTPTVSAELELILTYTIDHLGIFIGTRNYFYGDEVTNSPIVESSYNLQLFSGVGYSF